ncbi:hypothetical protein KY312_00580 [Candidatus Woesearchaeota archaeon]|nr:hypothetical protein [Candidatus Woesearchaeota archaeon]
MEKEEIYNQIEKGGLVIRTVCELLGGPKEHIDDTMKILVQKAKEYPKSTVLKEKIFETKEQEEGLFSAFTEFEILFNNLNTLMSFCFDFMPSSVEVVEPEKLSIDAHAMTSWINELQAKLHHVDKVAKETNVYKQIIHKQMNTIIRTNILTHLKQGDIEEKELQNYIGINEKTLKPYIDLLTKKKLIKLEDGKYKLTKPVKFK